MNNYNEYRDYPALKNLFLMLDKNYEYSKRRRVTNIIKSYNKYFSFLLKTHFADKKEKFYLGDILKKDYLNNKTKQFCHDFSDIELSHLKNYLVGKYRQFCLEVKQNERLNFKRAR